MWTQYSTDMQNRSIVLQTKVTAEENIAEGTTEHSSESALWTRNVTLCRQPYEKKIPSNEWISHQVINTEIYLK